MFGLVPILSCLFHFLIVTEEYRTLSQLLLIIVTVVLLIASCSFNSLQNKVIYAEIVTSDLGRIEVKLI